MGQLRDLIDLATQREMQANENALAANFAPPPQMSPAAEQAVIPFLRFCEQHRVPAVGAKPTTVAAYVQFLQDRGVPRPQVAESLSAIEALHIAAAVGSPVNSPVVAATVASTVDPPRSWPKADKEFFKTLPFHAQELIALREQDRETTLRRGQNELADMKKLLRLQQTGAAEPKPVEHKETNMKESDWNGEQGSSSMGKDKLKRSDPNSWKGTDISRRVDSNNSNEGFSGPLKPKGE
jgi:hypothetical protein